MAEDSAGDSDELLRRADDALYTAKESGRDRLSIWDAPLGAPGPSEHVLGA
jgi:PleD family two-component response regulator